MQLNNNLMQIKIEFTFPLVNIEDFTVTLVEEHINAKDRDFYIINCMTSESKHFSEHF